MGARNNIESTPDASRGADGLTERKRAFVAEYLKTRNGTQSAIKAGYSAKTAQQCSSRLLREPVIAAAIAKIQTAAMEKAQVDCGITLERTLREIARIAYFDPRKMFAADGRPLALHELDDDTAAVVAGLDVLEEWSGSGDDRVLVGNIKKWKLADKKGALDMLMKHQDGYNAENKGKAQPLADALAGFVSQIHKAGAGRLQFVPQAAKE